MFREGKIKKIDKNLRENGKYFFAEREWYELLTPTDPKVLITLTSHEIDLYELKKQYP